MAKNLLQDMIRVKNPARERGIESKFESLKRKPIRNIDNVSFVNEEEIPDRIKKSNKGSKYRIYFVALVSIVFLLFALSFFFSGAKITITPKVKEIPLNNENLSATKDQNTSDLSFDLVVIPGEESKIVQGSGVKDVSVAATGAVVIYNSYSSLPQIFAINTKLEGSNGKIYKTNKKVTVPGMTKAGKPGSVEVDISGLTAGVEYNSNPIDFKILGFKGTPKYSKFYARSKGNISGGLKGKTAIVSDLDKTTTISALKATLETKLLKKVTDQIPSGFILFKDAVFLDINDKDISFTPDQDNMVSVDIKGSLYGFLFDEKKLTKKIAEDSIDKYDESDVYIPNIRDLTFSLSDKETISFADVKNINFTLSGTPKIIWKVDEAKFVADILNKKKTDFNQILSQYSSIDTAVLVLRPFWKTTFPETDKNIQVIVNYPQ